MLKNREKIHLGNIIRMGIKIRDILIPITFTVYNVWFTTHHVSPITNNRKTS